MSDCEIQGNPDLYGEGVRFGIYAQWFATLLTTIFVKRDEATYRIANLIVQASIFLGLCIESRPGNPVVGAVITQYLLIGSLSSLTGDGISHASHLSGIARVTFYLALSAYGCWFWFVGVDRMDVPGCRAIVFFGEASVHGWFRTLGKVVSCVGLVVCVFFAAASVLQTRRRFLGGIRSGLARPPKERPQVEVSLMLLSMALMGCSIYLIEHLIRVNDVQGISAGKHISVGQLIPLLAGGMACVLTTMKVFVHRLFLKKRCWFLFGYHL